MDLGNGHRSRAWMLGPKAENSDDFERLLSAAFRDYCHWRRNFHPEDTAYVRAEDRLSDGFRDYFETLNDRLFEMLSHLKMSVPFFSPRYLGHMNTDLLTPGLLGYMAAMLYNQNNIVEGAAPITLRLETEAMKKIVGMLKLPEKKSWGHLCSGGSAANTEGLWVARQMALFPYQVAMARAQSGGQAGKIDSLVCGERNFGELVGAGGLSTMTIEETIDLAAKVEGLVKEDGDFGKILDACSAQTLGLAEFYRQAANTLKSVFPEKLKIILSRNAHYSLKKSAGILGLGQSDLVFVDLDEDFRMCMDMCRDSAHAVQAEGGKLLAVVGVYGSTEEGAIDDFDSIVKLRDELRGDGRGDFWLHADACYGGYAMAMLDSDQEQAPRGDVASEVDAIHALMEDLVKGVDVSLEPEEFVWGPGRIEQWVERSRAIGLADSIALDPHKLGLLPYPAGAVLFGDYRARELVRCDAPYLNAASGDKAEDEVWDLDFPGLYTLEGSRPGAYGAAAWLAHETVPLNRGGHGRIVADSILGSAALRRSLETRVKSSNDRFELACVPLGSMADLNIICYSFRAAMDGNIVTLSQMNRVIKKLYDRCLPTETEATHTKDFVIAKTELEVDKYTKAVPAFVKKLELDGYALPAKEFSRWGNPWRDVSSIEVIRSVIMGPFLLHASTRDRFSSKAEPLIKKYMEFLGRELPEVLLEVLSEPMFIDDYKSQKPALDGCVLVVEDDPRTQADIVTAVKGDFGFDTTGKSRVLWASSYDEAMNVIESDQKLTAALVDIDLGGGEERDGLAVLDKALSRELFKGAVVFSGMDETNPGIRNRIEAMRARRDGLIIRHQAKPRLVGEKRQKFGMGLNRVLSDLWDIQNSSADEQDERQ